MWYLVCIFYVSFKQLKFIIIRIFTWKRLVIPANPEYIKDIETQGIFFTLKSGENINKFDVYVQDAENRRILGFTSSRVLEAGLRMSKLAVMDATFKVFILAHCQILFILFRLPQMDFPSYSSFP